LATVLLRGVSEGILGRGSIDVNVTDGMTASDVVRSVVAMDERLKRPLLKEDGFTPRQYGTVLEAYSGPGTTEGGRVSYLRQRKTVRPS
jgi:hypothetical protein